MRKLHQYIGVLLISILFFQCQAPEVQSLDKETFFDLKAFMDEEAERLERDKVNLSKTVTLNGKSETKIITKPDFSVEFSEFYNSNINRTAWLDKYTETKDDKGIHYQSKDDKLEVKEMHIETVVGGKYIHISKKSRNMLNDASKELSYNSIKGYQIKSIRKSIGESADTLRIEVDYMK